MKIQIYAACQNGMDGSVNLTLFNTKEECYTRLNKTEEEIENGSPYDDGLVIPITLELDDSGKLLNTPFIDMDGIG